MPEIKKVEIETEETPQAQPTVAESQLQMAVTFGQMTEANRQLMNKLDQSEARQSQTESMLTEALSEIRALRLQTDTTSHQTEVLKESQTDILSAMTDASKSEETETVEVTPLMETKVQIEQTPVIKTRNFLQRIFF